VMLAPFVDPAFVINQAVRNISHSKFE